MTPSRRADTRAGDPGQRAEQRAAEFLEQRGFTLLARNVRYRFGELDLIGQSGDCIVFFEVRLRSSTRFGGAAASITGAKRKRCLRAAEAWLQQAKWTGMVRFDAILIDGAGRIDWIESAVEADE